MIERHQKELSDEADIRFCVRTKFGKEMEHEQEEFQLETDELKNRVSFSGGPCKTREHSAGICRDMREVSDCGVCTTSRFLAVFVLLEEFHLERNEVFSGFLYSVHTVYVCFS